MRLDIIVMFFPCAALVVWLIGSGVLFMLLHREKSPKGKRHFPAPTLDPRSLDFERGVEYGLLFAQVKAGGCAVVPVHADVAQLAGRLAKSRGLPFSAVPHKHGAACEGYDPQDCKDGREWQDVMIG